MASFPCMEPFHPAVRRWFEGRFPEGPTEPQAAGWPPIASGLDTLIAAPTGSAKTPPASLACTDRFFREAEALRRLAAREPAPGPLFGAEAEAGDGEAKPGVDVVYVSPLKALAADIQQNLQRPLEEIAHEARRRGDAVPEVRVAMRSGDTPASGRAAMLKRPPQILVTTPESLYLMLTAERSREVLRSVRTVIVDEIHAVARDKRGSHLAISLERLDALCDQRPTRVGLSATQRPIETLARLLVGAGPERSRPDGSPRCAIVDEGHRRTLDLALLLPTTDLEAVASKEQMGDVLDEIAGLVGDHRTTLVFVNTRRMSERLAHELAERLGEEGVAAHHGSLSKERRLRVESRLRAGELRALVATASLELGIDVGPVELVCQVGSPRSLATFLQRVGRSGHCRGGTPKGRLFPTSRDELVECAALLRGVREGRLDAIHPPDCPIDILAQQIVAACAADEWEESALYELMRGAAPFASLSRERFDAVVEMLAEGIQTGRGRRAAYLHRDVVSGTLRARRGARLAALTSGGAIPEVADYRVVAEPDDTFVGTVDEDFAIESMPGDIFLLGSTSWRIRRVEPGILRVVDAAGQPPSIPFWAGEAPSRTAELSEEVSRLRADVRDRLRAEGAEPRGRGQRAVAGWVAEVCGVSELAAQQLVRYLEVSLTALGAMPTQDELVFERFFDEAGGMQLVIHSPLGGRINRALCLSLRKKFCRSFNFELQAAANDDAMVLSLGPHHSFALEGVPRFLSSKTVEDTLSQAILGSPMMNTRWRWNLNRSLAVLRMRGGKRNPPPIQRMEADDLMAAVFPNVAACQENVSFPIEIPDHPLVSQTLHDCLHEAMDVEGLRALVLAFETGGVRCHFVDTSEASPLSHEILNGRPYTYLDDAPLEERRTRAVVLRRGLPVEARELARLDPDAIARVRAEAAPEPRSADELHDLLLSLVVLPERTAWRSHFDALLDAGRARCLVLEDAVLWCAVERCAAARAIHPQSRVEPDRPIPERLAARPKPDAGAALQAALRGWAELLGPFTVERVAALLRVGPTETEVALAALESDGLLLRGRFEEDEPHADPAAGGEEYCARHLLTRIHRYTQDRLRREIEPVSAQEFMRFLLRWQHVAPGTRVDGPRGVADVIEQLQGFELAAGAWEESVLPARVQGYRADWLDALSLSGQLCWGRFGGQGDRRSGPASAGVAAEAGAPSARTMTSRATPLAFALRGDLDWLLQAHRGGAEPVGLDPGVARDILERLEGEGALFHADLVARLGRLPVEVEEGLWGLVARGLVTADGFGAVRALLGARERWARTRARERRRRGLRRGLLAGTGPGLAEGRWSPLPAPAPVDDADALAEAMAEQLLARWGVVFREVLTRESIALPWRDLVWAMRRLEARGLIRGGRFVSGFSGEQFALPEAVDRLRKGRRIPRSGERVRICAADPLNLAGILTPGPRIPALRGGEVVFVDGLPSTAEAASALPSRPEQTELGGAV